tara:strand:+ start:1026 stop:1334 length:309 start_codon:yes stop_codon:yes gene_type:complete
MAFKLKRDRKSNKRSKLLSRLKQLKAKKSLTSKEKSEMDKILVILKKKATNKIESKKLNNNKQDEIAKAIYNGDNSLENLNLGHLTSTTGNYRKGRIANFKN